MVFMYASKAESAAAAGQAPVEVLVAKEAIPAGTSGATIAAGGQVELRTMPTSSVPEGALSDLTGVSELLNAVPIYAGQVLISDMFSGADKTTALTLPKGSMAMSVELKDPQRVAGFVTPGSEVAIFATLERKVRSTTGPVAGPAAGPEASPAASPGATASPAAGGTTQPNIETETVADLLLDRVRVVAVGPSTLRATGSDDPKTTNSEEIPTAIITLAVTQEQAKKLAFAYSEAELHFALLDPNSKVGNGVTVDNNNIFQ